MVKNILMVFGMFFLLSVISIGQEGKTRAFNFINSHLSNYILAAADSSNLDPLLVDAVIWIESRGKHESTSDSGSIGAMQLTSPVYKKYKINPRDLSSNIIVGSLYLRELMDGQKEKNGDTLSFCLTAYNSGKFRDSWYSKKVLEIYNLNLRRQDGGQRSP